LRHDPGETDALQPRARTVDAEPADEGGEGRARGYGGLRLEEGTGCGEEGDAFAQALVDEIGSGRQRLVEAGLRGRVFVPEDRIACQCPDQRREPESEGSQTQALGQGGLP